MSADNVFRPGGTGVSLSVTSTTSNSALTVNDTVRLVNLGPSKCYVAFGTSASLAAGTSDMCLPMGTEVFYAKGMTYIAAICDATETTTLKAIAGAGI
jgi:hypothetical protein